VRESSIKWRKLLEKLESEKSERGKPMIATSIQFSRKNILKSMLNQKILEKL
jgi:hypothetical protein